MGKHGAWNQDDMDAEIMRTLETGKSFAAIGQMFGCSGATVCNRAAQLGVPSRRKNVKTFGYETPEASANTARLIELWADPALSIAQIAAELGVTNDRISATVYRLRHLGVDLRPRTMVKGMKANIPSGYAGMAEARPQPVTTCWSEGGVLFSTHYDSAADWREGKVAATSERPLPPARSDARDAFTAIIETPDGPMASPWRSVTPPKADGMRQEFAPAPRHGGSPAGACAEHAAALSGRP